MMQGVKKCIRFLVCLVVMLAVPVLCVEAESAATVELEAPIEITNVKLNKKTARKGSNVKYSFTIKNVGIDEYLVDYDDSDELGAQSGFPYIQPPYYYGSDTVYVYWKSSKKQTIVQTFHWKKADKKKGQLKISGTIPVRKGMKTGKWRMVAILFEYEGREFWVRDCREEVEEDVKAPALDLSGLDFKVTGTGKADNKAPTLDLQSFKLSKTYVGKKQKSTFSFKVKDSSKIEEVVCIWDIYDKTNKGNVGDYYGIYRMKYNKKLKRYQCSIGLDTSYESKAQLVGIEVRDIYGNEKNYYAYKDMLSFLGSDRKKTTKYYKAYKYMTIRRK